MGTYRQIDGKFVRIDKPVKTPLSIRLITFAKNNETFQTIGKCAILFGTVAALAAGARAGCNAAWEVKHDREHKALKNTSASKNPMHPEHVKGHIAFYKAKGLCNGIHER